MISMLELHEPESEELTPPRDTILMQIVAWIVLNRSREDGCPDAREIQYYIEAGSGEVEHPDCSKAQDGVPGAAQLPQAFGVHQCL